MKPNRRGMALPVTLLLLVALSLLAGAGFLRAFMEDRIAENHAAAVRAFYLADGGLNQALAAAAVDTTAASTASSAVDGGTVTIEARRLVRLDPLRTLRLITAEGSYDPEREGAARRTVAQLVLTPHPLVPPAAVVSLDTIVLERASVSGFDPAAADCPPATAAVAGLAAPPGVFSGDSAALAGTPPLLEDPGLAARLTSAGLDWTNVRRQEFVEPEVLVADSWPSSRPDDPATWPVTYVLPSAPPIADRVSGRGTLVVPGDLTVTGDLRWRGLVLVGGLVHVAGRLEVAGALIAGLNSGAGGASGRSRLVGEVRVRYESCAVAGAAARLSGLPRRRPGGWYEIF